MNFTPVSPRNKEQIHISEDIDQLQNSSEKLNTKHYLLEHTAAEVWHPEQFVMKELKISEPALFPILGTHT